MSWTKEKSVDQAFDDAFERLVSSSSDRHAVLNRSHRPKDDLRHIQGTYEEDGSSRSTSNAGPWESTSGSRQVRQSSVHPALDRLARRVRPPARISKGKERASITDDDEEDQDAVRTATFADNRPAPRQTHSISVGPATQYIPVPSSLSASHGQPVMAWSPPMMPPQTAPTVPAMPAFAYPPAFSASVTFSQPQFYPGHQPIMPAGAHNPQQIGYPSGSTLMPTSMMWPSVQSFVHSAGPSPPNYNPYALMQAPAVSITPADPALPRTISTTSQQVWSTNPKPRPYRKVPKASVRPETSSSIVTPRKKLVKASLLQTSEQPMKEWVTPMAGVRQPSLDGPKRRLVKHGQPQLASTSRQKSVQSILQQQRVQQRRRYAVKEEREEELMDDEAFIRYATAAGARVEKSRHKGRPALARQKSRSSNLGATTRNIFEEKSASGVPSVTARSELPTTTTPSAHTSAKVKRGHTARPSLDDDGQIIQRKRGRPRTRPLLPLEVDEAGSPSMVQIKAEIERHPENDPWGRGYSGLLESDSGPPGRAETHTLFVHSSRKLRSIVKLAVHKASRKAGEVSDLAEWSRWTWSITLPDTGAGSEGRPTKSASDTSSAIATPLSPASRKEDYMTLLKTHHSSRRTATPHTSVTRLLTYLRQHPESPDKPSEPLTEQQLEKLCHKTQHSRPPTQLDLRSLWVHWAKHAHENNRSARIAGSRARVSFADDAIDQPRLERQNQSPGPSMKTSIKAEPESPSRLLREYNTVPSPPSVLSSVRLKTEEDEAQDQTRLNGPTSQAAVHEAVAKPNRGLPFLRRNLRVWKVLGLTLPDS